jgi:hypothetical protein
MGKRKIITFILLPLLLIPFTYAYLNPTESNIINMICFLIVAFGALFLLVLNLSGGTQS